MNAGSLKSRLTRLEADRAPPGRMVVVPKADDETNNDALALAGAETFPSDLVVFIRHFDGLPADRTPRYYLIQV